MKVRKTWIFGLSFGNREICNLIAEAQDHPLTKANGLRSKWCENPKNRYRDAVSGIGNKMAESTRVGQKRGSLETKAD